MSIDVLETPFLVDAMSAMCTCSCHLTHLTRWIGKLTQRILFENGTPFKIIAILIFKSWMHPNLRFMTTRSEAISFPADFFRKTEIHVRFWVVLTDVKRLLRELDWCWLWSRRNSLLWFSKPWWPLPSWFGTNLLAKKKNNTQPQGWILSCA